MPCAMPLPWTPAEWASIIFYARIARDPQPMLVQALTSRGAQRHAVKRLRELAVRTEILNARKMES